MGDSWLPEQKPFWVDLTECCGQYPHVCRAGLQESRNQGSWAVLPTVGICMHGATSLPTSQGCPEDPRDKQAESPECVKLHLMESVSPAYSRGGFLGHWQGGQTAEEWTCCSLSLALAVLQLHPLCMAVESMPTKASVVCPVLGIWTSAATALTSGCAITSRGYSALDL